MTKENTKPAATDPVYAAAVSLFEELFRQARALDVKETDVMTLATCSRDGHPTARIVLLRGFDARGFDFYTNSTSCKGQQLSENPQAALCFYWDGLGKQVRMEGTVLQLAGEASDAYWSRRHRLSQLASAASLQSQRLDSRETYERRIADLDQQLAGDEVARPQHWYGFRVVPRRIEFWTSAENRMHHRQIYEQTAQGWETYLLYP